jgi:hypothetical protein
VQKHIPLAKHECEYLNGPTLHSSSHTDVHRESLPFCISASTRQDSRPRVFVVKGILAPTVGHFHHHHHFTECRGFHAKQTEIINEKERKEERRYERELRKFRHMKSENDESPTPWPLLRSRKSHSDSRTSQRPVELDASLVPFSVHKRPAFVLTLTQINPVHIICSYLSLIQFNIAHPPTSWFSW